MPANIEKLLDALGKPFTADEIEWKLQTSNGKSGLAVPYVQSRAIQQRLDECAGPFNWQNSYTQWRGASQLCGISIFNEERGEWVTKWDGADDSDYEPVKGGLSDAFKRASVQWSIGRYLYQMEGVWVDVEKNAKGKDVIKKSEFAKLDRKYGAAIADLLKGKRIPVAEDDDKLPEPLKDEQKPQKPPLPVKDADKITPITSAYMYEICSVKDSKGSSGVFKVVELSCSDDKKITAYFNGESSELKEGRRLTNVDLTKMNGDIGTYYIMKSFTLAENAA